MVEENQESFRIVKLAYDLGDIRLIDLLNQQRVLIDARSGYIDVLENVLEAEVDLERAAGTAFLLQ